MARYGGEELILLVPGTDSAAALLVGEKLRAAVAALAVDVGPKALRATLSVGAAIVEDGLVPALLVANADAALYRAKRAGKNRVELHTGGAMGLRQPSAG